MLNLKLGLEAINHNHESMLFSELTIFVGELMGNTTRASTLDAMAKAVMKYTGLNVEFSVIHNAEGLACAIIPPLLGDNPLNSQGYTQRISSLPLDAFTFKGMFKGEINLSAGKLSGDFSRVMFQVYLDSSFLNDTRFTPEGIAAILIHELGHPFTYLYELAEMYRTNAVLREVSRIFIGTRDTKIRVNSLDIIERLYSVKFEDKKVLADNPDTDAVSAVVAGLAVRKMRSELGTSYYDERLAEFLADQFAARHGAGLALVQALLAMRSTAGRNIQYLPNYAGWTRTLLTMGLIGVLVNGVALAPLLGIGALIGFAFNINAAANESAPSRDDPTARFEAIERELISSLKSATLPTVVKNSIIRDIAAIRKEVEGLSKYNYPYTRIVQYLGQTFSGVRREVKFQQDLEKLANNDLFVSAAKLSTLQE